MITFKKGNYTKQEMYVFKHLIEDTKYLLTESWTECDTYGEKCCEECYCRNICKDLDRLLDYLDTVENPVETVENQNH